MWKNISRREVVLGLLAGGSIVLAFVPFHLVLFIFLFPVFLNLLASSSADPKKAFLYGFVASFVVNAGGFYWMIYTIHVFGYLPWVVSALIFLVFCGFGALNVPVFAALANFLNKKARLDALLPFRLALWYVLGLPALFTFIEYLIPKLFPFYFGHCLYWIPWVTQIAELTGGTIFSFAIYSLGGALTLTWLAYKGVGKCHPAAWAIPLALWGGIILFSVQRLAEPPVKTTSLRVALIQANIGSLEKVDARRGMAGKVRYVLDRYEELTTRAMKHNPPPELILWPETAVPFQLEGYGPYPEEIRQSVRRWGVPLITGGYAPDPSNLARDYNAAYFFEPTKNGELHKDIYRKNVLLAFGEYFPGGDTFPFVYKLFDQVSNFARGTEQNAFTFQDGRKLGVTICYEDLIPSFYSKVVHGGVNGVVNLTNDSWFGPSTEPYHHAALATFRAIETRLPLIRVTNTGISLTIDDKGIMSPTTGVYEEDVLHQEVALPVNPVQTFYLRFGDWFIIVCVALIAAHLPLIKRGYRASLSH